MASELRITIFFDPTLYPARMRDMLHLDVHNLSTGDPRDASRAQGQQDTALPDGAILMADRLPPSPVMQLSHEWVAEVAAIAQARDQSAFAAVFRHFAPRVKAFLMKSGADEALAEECMQDVMATLWRKAHLFDPTRASVSTWIFTIARNRKIDLLRKYARPEPEDLPWGPEAEPDQEDVLALQQESQKLAEALRKLPQKQRILIEKAYFGDLTHGEIALETGLPLGTIKSRIRLALERLRHNMRHTTK